MWAMLPANLPVHYKQVKVITDSNNKKVRRDFKLKKTKKFIFLVFFHQNISSPFCYNIYGDLE
jgi:hypothetical protein